MANGDVRNIDIVLEAFGLANDLMDFPRDWHKKFVRNVLIATVAAIFAAYFLKNWDMGIIDILFSIALLVGGLIMWTQPVPVATILGWGIFSGTLKTPETIGEETAKAFKLVYVLAGKVMFYLSFIFFLIGTFPIPITFPWFCTILAGGLLIAWGIFAWEIPGVMFRNSAFAYIGIILAWGLLSQGWNYVVHTETDNAMEEIQAKQKEMEKEDNLQALAYLQEKIENAHAITDKDVQATLTRNEYSFYKKMKTGNQERSVIQGSVSEVSDDLNKLPPGAKKFLRYLLVIGIAITGIMIATKVFKAVTDDTTAPAAATKDKAAAKKGGFSIIKLLVGILLLLFIIAAGSDLYHAIYEKNRWETVGKVDFDPSKFDETSGNWQGFTLEPGREYKISWRGNYPMVDYSDYQDARYEPMTRPSVDPQTGLDIDAFHCAIMDYVPDKSHHRGMLIGRSGTHSVENGKAFIAESRRADFALNLPDNVVVNCDGKVFDLSPSENFTKNVGESIKITVERARY